MALIDHIDAPNRKIYLSAATKNTSVHPIDIYIEMRALRSSDETLRGHDVFLSAFGNVAKGGGKFTERYVRENSGTRIIPYDADGYLTVIGTVITDDGQEGIACFDRTGFTFQVDINYVPPQVEVVQVATGSGVSAQDIVDIKDAVWTDEEPSTGPNTKAGQLNRIDVSTEEV